MGKMKRGISDEPSQVTSEKRPRSEKNLNIKQILDSNEILKNLDFSVLPGSRNQSMLEYIEGRTKLQRPYLWNGRCGGPIPERWDNYTSYNKFIPITSNFAILPAKLPLSQQAFHNSVKERYNRLFVQ